MEFLFTGEGGVKAEFIFSDQEALSDLHKYAIQETRFTGKSGELFFYPSLEGKPRLLIGLGKTDALTLTRLRKALFKTGHLLDRHGQAELTLELPAFAGLDPRQSAEAAAEGLLRSAYRFDRYRSDKKPVVDLKVHVLAPQGMEDETRQGIEEARLLNDSVVLARDLVNERANVISPQNLAEQAVLALEPYGVKVTVYEPEAIAEIGMKAFLAVARASARPARLIVMEYSGAPAEKTRTALVGKGLTYDSGGYSMKTSPQMKTMFCDMAGAATVIAALQAIARAGLKANVTAVVAACDNMVSGDGYRPGDILDSLSGKTIEIDNTDAEGRLTLADAVFYATDVLGCDRVIDLATLTGACVVALGEHYTGAITNDPAFLAEVKTAAERALERIWELPSDPDYAKKNESQVADLKNSGGRNGGTISAGLFVGAFVAENRPWVHLDIAGTAYLDKALDDLDAGATGVQVKTLYRLFA